MPASSKDGPVGQLFLSYDRDGHDAEVITLGVDFDPINHQLKAVTFLTVDIQQGEDASVRLQRFSADKDAVSIPLSAEEIHMLIRETGVLFERRLKHRR